MAPYCLLQSACRNRGAIFEEGLQRLYRGRVANQWEKDGQKHYTTEIIANEMQMLGGRGDGGGNTGGGNGGGRPEYGSNNSNSNDGGYDQSRGNDNSGYNGGGNNQGNKQSNDYAAPPKDDFNDDIPF